MTALLASAVRPDIFDEPGGRDDALLEVVDLSVSFPITKGILFERTVGEIKAVDGVTFSVPRGRTLGLVGESGSGKTTVGRAIVRIAPTTGGSIRFDGSDITAVEGHRLRALRRQIQMVFQDPYASLDPRMRAEAIIAEPLAIHGIGTPSSRRHRARELMELVGLDPATGARYPHEFSGGQRQRIGVARALSVGPALVVADEPVSSLDVSIQAQLINLLQRLQRDLGLTYLFIAHDLAVVRHISETIAVMYLGRLVETLPAAELLANPRHPYTVALLSAVPQPDPVREATRRRIVLAGEVPSAAKPPSGCSFHTRCWLYERLGQPERCRAERPAFAQVASGHRTACHFSSDVPAASRDVLAGVLPPAPPNSPPA